jgi:hypothetical protein
VVRGHQLWIYATVSVLIGCSNGTTARPDGTSPVLDAAELRCDGFRADPQQPPPDFTVLFDAVALPTSETYPSALQTGLQVQADPAGRLFAKTGLMYRPGRDFELVVPERLRGRLSIGWAQRAWRVTNPVCPGVPDEWMWLPGGYWVANTMCADLIVRSGADERHVSIGLGTPCPGQTPPQGPSDQ